LTIPATKKRTVRSEITVGDHRKLRVIEIPTEQGTLIRVANYIDRPVTELSGVVFSSQYLDEVIAALEKLRGEYA
jgi:hypothetical protein